MIMVETPASDVCSISRSLTMHAPRMHNMRSVVDLVYDYVIPDPFVTQHDTLLTQALQAFIGLSVSDASARQGRPVLCVQAAAQQAAQQALQQHQQGHSLPDLHNAGRQSQLLALLKEKQQAQAQQQLAALQQQRQHAATAAASIGGGAAGQTLAPTALGQPASPKGLPSAGSPGPGMGSSLGGAAVAGGGGVGSGSIDDIAVYVAAIKEVMASEDINKPQVLQQLSIVLKQAVQVGGCTSTCLATFCTPFRSAPCTGFHFYSMCPQCSGRLCRGV